jgi:hypothetical protein
MTRAYSRVHLSLDPGVLPLANVTLQGNPYSKMEQTFHDECSKNSVFHRNIAWLLALSPRARSI